MEHYIAPLSAGTERTHVRYRNRFGITLAGDLYVSKEADRTKRLPAVVIGAPYGGVKEQGPCVYADELAKRGFAALTFDPSFNGESEGSRATPLRPRSFRRTSPQASIFSARSALSTVKRSRRSASAGAAVLPFPPRRRISASGRSSPRACTISPAYRQEGGRTA